MYGQALNYQILGDLASLLAGKNCVTGEQLLCHLSPAFSQVGAGRSPSQLSLSPLYTESSGQPPLGAHTAL